MEINRRARRRFVPELTKSNTVQQVRPLIPEYKKRVVDTKPIVSQAVSTVSIKAQLVTFAVLFKRKIRVVQKRSIVLWKQQNRKRQVVLGIFSLIIVGSLVTLFTFTPSKKPSSDTNNDVLGGSSFKPTFKPLLPEGNTPDVQEGRYAYDAEKQVVSFQDKVEASTVTISQQLAPESFKEDSKEELRKIAEQFNANQELTVGSDTAYLGTSANGPQSVIFYKNGLLIFLYSSQKVSTDSWQKYIETLE